MDINFTEELADGSITFTGSLDKDEVSFLLKFSLMSLLSRGMMPASILVSGTTGDGDTIESVPEKKDMN